MTVRELSKCYVIIKIVILRNMIEYQRRGNVCQY